MEVAPCAQDDGLYAASVLKYLNLQRGQGQFCDCVLRQNSDQIYPAHRCVLAASSPVFATILSSTGALVELQDLCVSGSVMASLLDYIYTGLLPSPLNQQQYYKLLAVADHLQMKELQEALRAARKQEIVEEIPKTSNGAGELSLSSKTESFRPEGTSAQYSSNEVTINTASINSRVKSLEKSCNRPGAKTLTGLQESDDKIHADDETEVTSFAQGFMQNDHVTSEVCEANQGVYERQYNVNGFANAEVCKRGTEGILEWTPEGRRRSSSSSSSSQHPCCGVPVICHSRRASVLQMAEACEASQSSISSSMISVSRSSSIDNDNTVKGVPTKRKDREGAHNPDSINHKKQTPCITHLELNNHHSSSHMNQIIANENEQSCNSFTHNTDHTSQHALSNSLQSKINHLREDLSQNEYLGKSLKHQRESDFDHFPSKHRRLDCFECNVKLTREIEEQIKDRGAVVPLPVQDSETGSDSTYGDGEDVEVKEEHESSSESLTETDVQDSHCNQYGAETNWSPNAAEAVKNTTSNQKKYKSNRTSTSSESGSEDATGNLCVFNGVMSPEHREISEPCLSSTTCEDNMPDPISGTINQLYHGHLHYQWLPHQDAHLSMQDFAHKYSSQSSNDSADEEEANGSFSLSGQRPLMQLFSSENTDQVLLLDINTKPAELLVTLKRRSESEKKEVILRDAAEVRNPDETQRSEDPSEGFGGINRQENVGEKDSDQGRTGAAQNAASNEGEASSVGVPDPVQTSMSSRLSVCKSSCLPADRSAHRSSPHLQPFQCSLCDRSFSQRGSLNRHVRSHLGVRPFSCPRCPMTFSRQYRVTEHMRVHQRCALRSVFQKPSDSFRQLKTLKDNEEKQQH